MILTCTFVLNPTRPTAVYHNNRVLHFEISKQMWCRRLRDYSEVEKTNKKISHMRVTLYAALNKNSRSQKRHINCEAVKRRILV